MLFRSVCPQTLRRRGRLGCSLRCTWPREARQQRRWKTQGKKKKETTRLPSRRHCAPPSRSQRVCGRVCLLRSTHILWGIGRFSVETKRSSKTTLVLFSRACKISKAWSSAAHLQLIHAAALLAISQSPALLARTTGYAAPLMLAGTIMFSGSIYGLILDTEKKISRALKL